MSARPEQDQPKRPTVGVFDSGVGGLSVLRRMLEVDRPPWGRIVYLADLAHFPYGPRPTDEVRRLGLAGVGVLADRGASLVAVACNTASSSGVTANAPDAAVPIVDIIAPGARQVASLAAEDRLAGAAGRVIVLGTEGTVRNRVWERALRDAGFEGAVVGWPCPFLANLIEEGKNGLVAKRAVFEATRGLQAGPPGPPGPPEIVVLGCTHYPFAAATIAEVLATQVLGHPVRTVDPAGALVAQLAARLEKTAGRAEGLAAGPGEDPAEVWFLTTGRSAHFAERARQLLADKLSGGHHGLRLDEVREVGFPDLPA